MRENVNTTSWQAGLWHIIKTAGMLFPVFNDLSDLEGFKVGWDLTERAIETLSQGREQNNGSTLRFLLYFYSLLVLRHGTAISLLTKPVQNSKFWNIIVYYVKHTSKYNKKIKQG